MKSMIVLAGALLTATVLAMAPARAEGDAAAGKKVFNKCMACHDAVNDKSKVGPSLHNVVGRKAGTFEGFKYSDAMKKADVTWSNETLDKYLTDPKGFVPGNRMSFAGVKKEADRKAVIDYLDTVK